MTFFAGVDIEERRIYGSNAEFFFNFAGQSFEGGFSKNHTATVRCPFMVIGAFLEEDLIIFYNEARSSWHKNRRMTDFFANIFNIVHS